MDLRHAVPLVGLVVILLGGFGGCTKFYWTKSGSTAEQFDRDSRECAIQASSPLTGGELNSKVYQACLRTRGYTRAPQSAPPGPGSYRGLDDEGEPVVITATPAGAPRAGMTVTVFEAELAKLDDLKARGRITPDEYAVMRLRLVEAYDPAAQGRAAAATASLAKSAVQDVLGRWRRIGSPDGALTLTEKTSGRLGWTYESLAGDALAAAPPSPQTLIYRAGGTGTISGDDIALDGTVLAGEVSALNKPLFFVLKRSGSSMKGTAKGPGDAPVPVEFTR